MSHTVEPEHNPCIVAGVQPLLTELQEPVRIYFRGPQDAGREPLEHFIHHAFEKNFAADLQAFYPNLAVFTTDDRIRGVIGYRHGVTQPLFSEHYLDAPAEQVMATHLNQCVERRQVVEVGNMALAGYGEARWAIAAMSVFLHAAGYRWVLFTAIKPVFNAFHRLGLNPVQIAIPDPARLPDSGKLWGSYYHAGPRVYAGNIEAGFQKLDAHISQRQPRIHALLQEARRIGMNIRRTGSSGIRQVV